jgi:hypothetical protein
LEKRIGYNVAFAIFTTDNPVAALHIAGTQVSGDSLCFCALLGVYQQWPASSKSAHDSSAGNL